MQQSPKDLPHHSLPHLRVVLRQLHAMNHLPDLPFHRAGCLGFQIPALLKRLTKHFMAALGLLSCCFFLWMRGGPGELRITDQLIQADGYRLTEILPVPLLAKQKLLELTGSLARLSILQRFLESRGLAAAKGPAEN